MFTNKPVYNYQLGFKQTYFRELTENNYLYKKQLNV